MHHRDLWLADSLSRQLTPTERQLLHLASELMQRLADAADTDPPETVDSASQ
jgi:hypothetical protein